MSTVPQPDKTSERALHFIDSTKRSVGHFNVLQISNLIAQYRTLRDLESKTDILIPAATEYLKLYLPDLEEEINIRIMHLCVAEGSVPYDLQVKLWREDQGLGVPGS